MPFLSLDDPFKSPHACTPVREYGASDVTSDESTDLSSPAEPSSPQAPDVDDHADISPSVPIILPDRHVEDALSVDILELHQVSTCYPSYRHTHDHLDAQVLNVLALLCIGWRFPLILIPFQQRQNTSPYISFPLYPNPYIDDRAYYLQWIPMCVVQDS